MASLADGVHWEAAAQQCARLDDGARLGAQAAMLGGNRSFENRRCDMVSICALIGFQEELPLALWCLRRDRRHTPAADVCRRGSDLMSCGRARGRTAACDHVVLLCSAPSEHAL